MEVTPADRRPTVKVMKPISQPHIYVDRRGTILQLLDGSFAKRHGVAPELVEKVGIKKYTILEKTVLP